VQFLDAGAVTAIDRRYGFEIREGLFCHD